MNDRRVVKIEEVVFAARDDALDDPQRLLVQGRAHEVLGARRHRRVEGHGGHAVDAVGPAAARRVDVRAARAGASVHGAARPRLRLVGTRPHRRAFGPVVLRADEALFANPEDVVRRVGVDHVVAGVDHAIRVRARTVEGERIELVGRRVRARLFHRLELLALRSIVLLGALGVGLARAEVRAVRGVVVRERDAALVVIGIAAQLLVAANHPVARLRALHGGGRILDERVAGLAARPPAKQTGDVVVAEEDHAVRAGTLVERDAARELAVFEERRVGREEAALPQPGLVVVVGADEARGVDPEAVEVRPEERFVPNLGLGEEVVGPQHRVNHRRRNLADALDGLELGQRGRAPAKVERELAEVSGRVDGAGRARRSGRGLRWTRLRDGRRLGIAAQEPSIATGEESPRRGDAGKEKSERTPHISHDEERTTGIHRRVSNDTLAFRRRNPRFRATDSSETEGEDDGHRHREGREARAREDRDPHPTRCDRPRIHRGQERQDRVGRRRDRGRHCGGGLHDLGRREVAHIHRQLENRRCSRRAGRRRGAWASRARCAAAGWGRGASTRARPALRSPPPGGARWARRGRASGSRRRRGLPLRRGWPESLIEFALTAHVGGELSRGVGVQGCLVFPITHARASERRTTTRRGSHPVPYEGRHPHEQHSGANR